MTFPSSPYQCTRQNNPLGAVEGAGDEGDLVFVWLIVQDVGVGGIDDGGAVDDVFVCGAALVEEDLFSGFDFRKLAEVSVSPVPPVPGDGEVAFAGGLIRFDLGQGDAEVFLGRFGQDLFLQVDGRDLEFQDILQLFF